jgi:hypothetical protein
MSTVGVAPAHEVEPAGHLQLNVLSLRADATVSTFGNLSAGHSIIAASTSSIQYSTAQISKARSLSPANSAVQL